MLVVFIFVMFLFVIEYATNIIRKYTTNTYVPTSA